MNANMPIAILAYILACGCFISIGVPKAGYAAAAQASETDPLNATYRIDFKPPSSGSKGTVILKKDNPTGKPEFDDSLELPVGFK